ncbi:YdgH/BhsA/McbA-like domain containing protein, partial [Escherichia sp. R-CC3]
MKLKNTLLASALLSATAFSVNAATELTPEQAAAVKPFDRVVVTGRFNAIGEAVKAVSRRADKEGAASFYVADRIVVMREGEIAGELLHEQADERQA